MITEVNPIVQYVMVAAFPLLIGIVAHYARKIISDIRALQASHTQLLILQSELKGAMTKETAVLQSKIEGHSESISELKMRMRELERAVDRRNTHE